MVSKDKDKSDWEYKLYSDNGSEELKSLVSEIQSQGGLVNKIFSGGIKPQLLVSHEGKPSTTYLGYTQVVPYLKRILESLKKRREEARKKKEESERIRIKGVRTTHEKVDVEFGPLNQGHKLWLIRERLRSYEPDSPTPGLEEEREHIEFTYEVRSDESWSVELARVMGRRLGQGWKLWNEDPLGRKLVMDFRPNAYSSNYCLEYEVDELDVH